jgi:purine nucleosidase
VLKIHLDTDLGGDIDDLCALAMVLNWPDVDLLAVTTVADDRGKRAGYVQYALRLAGREDIPVASGADVSLGCYRFRPGLLDENIYWPEPIPATPAPIAQALSLLERSIEQGAIVATIGPFTNLALLERRSPGILGKVRLYVMGGYVFPPRAGFPRWDNHMDYNVQADVQSAQLVLRHASPTLIPLSVTIETALRRSHLATLRRTNLLAQLIASQAEALATDENYETLYGRTCEGLPADIINFQHDPLACAIALGWREGVKISEIPLKVDIEDGWLQQRVDDRGKPTSVVTHVKGRLFDEFRLRTVAGKTL